jgi:alpha-L-fucosidase
MSDAQHGNLTPEQESFKDAKFGMFFHWSLFSLPTGHENWRTPEGAMGNFHAKKFDAGRWVGSAVEAGARYITFTSKHHDGFCLFSTDLTDFNSAKSPAGRDFVALLSEECQERGMPIFIYYSLADHQHTGFRPGKPAWEDYLRYYHGQIEELCSNYGEISGFWLDPGPWHGMDYDYQIDTTEDIIRGNQPGALLMGRDFYESEKGVPDLPGTMGRLNNMGEGDPREMPAPAPGNWPFEVCDTINDSWQYNESDRNLKSTGELLRKLVRVTGLGGNYLLNQSPMGSGELDPLQVRILREMGTWLNHEREALYGTRPLGLTDWGPVVTGNGTNYLFIMDPTPDGGSIFPAKEPDQYGITIVEIDDADTLLRNQPGSRQG